MPALFLTFAIHAHQPVGNFDSVIQEAFDKAYNPFLAELARHPAIKLALHFTGPLYDWFDVHAPDYCERVKELAVRGQVEILSGGYYEPVLAVLPEAFRQRQIVKLSRFIWERFGQRPKGMWLAERVWEPQLASSIARAGIEYALLDDTHFRAAGLGDQNLTGHFITEDGGETIALIPGAMKLRYLIPFADPEKTIEYLREIHARATQDVLVTMGDDLEKFGTWPETYDLCYTRGWLDRFFTALENDGEWLRLTLPRDYLADHQPLGRIYIPTTSYMEMGEWSLPADSAQRFEPLLHSAQENEGTNQFPALDFLRGGFWRNFLTKYRESNLIHKRMLDVCSRLVSLEHQPRQPETKPLLEAAEDALLRSQCNDAYWHGIFGGLYSPHLRTAVLGAIIEAESLLDRIDHLEAQWVDFEYRDFDCDGSEECLVSTPHFSAAVDLEEGGLSYLDYKPRRVSLINSLQRRPEAYHDRIRGLANHSEEPVTSATGPDVDTVSIHSILKAKEKGLDRFLVYDQFARNCFTSYALAADVSLEEFSSGEGRAIRFDRFTRQKSSSPASLVFESIAPLAPIEPGQTSGTEEVVLQVGLRFDGARPVVNVSYHLTELSGSALDLRFAAEFNLNFHAPDAHDRYYLIDGARFPLKTESAWRHWNQITMIDEWQGVRVDLRSVQEADWWCFPIYTVSQSEDGIERVYQGSAIVAVSQSLTPFEISLEVTEL